jgi:hypothetical protein
MPLCGTDGKIAPIATYSSETQCAQDDINLNNGKQEPIVGCFTLDIPIVCMNPAALRKPQ